MTIKKPTTDGGVWGSYVEYVKALEAAVAQQEAPTGDVLERIMDKAAAEVKRVLTGMEARFYNPENLSIESRINLAVDISVHIAIREAFGLPVPDKGQEATD